MSPLEVYRRLTIAELVSALEVAFRARNCRAEFLIHCEMRRRCGARRAT